jgi:hypothetical protein
VRRRHTPRTNLGDCAIGLPLSRRRDRPEQPPGTKPGTEHQLAAGFERINVNNIVNTARTQKIEKRRKKRDPRSPRLMPQLRLLGASSLRWDGRIQERSQPSRGAASSIAARLPIRKHGGRWPARAAAMWKRTRETSVDRPRARWPARGRVGAVRRCYVVSGHGNKYVLGCQSPVCGECVKRKFAWNSPHPRRVGLVCRPQGQRERLS